MVQNLEADRRCARYAFNVTRNLIYEITEGCSSWRCGEQWTVPGVYVWIAVHVRWAYQSRSETIALLEAGLGRIAFQAFSVPSAS